MKILNLYAGIGGNRKLWQNVDVTAVELNKEIASIYSDFYPNDTVIVGDAMQFLIEHYNEFDFIWSSPPCQTNSRIRYCMAVSKTNQTTIKPKYPDLSLYQQIIFLNKYLDQNKYFVVENVLPYYEPLIKPTAIIDRHCLWTNFKIAKTIQTQPGQTIEFISTKKTHYGIDLKSYKTKTRKSQIIRNLVNPELGLYLLENATQKFQYNYPYQEPELF